MHMDEFKNLKPFAKGKRSYIYVKKIKKKKIAFKVVIDKKRTKDVINNEYKFLKILNKYKIGPRLVKVTPYYVSYEFVDGKKILDWIKISNRKDIILVLKKILKQCYTMDKLKINKKELHKPIKHIIIKNKTPKMIDFERCYFTNNQKNVTQFCQFLISKNVSKILKGKKINIKKSSIIKSLKTYKRNKNQTNFNRILSITN